MTIKWRKTLGLDLKYLMLQWPLKKTLCPIFFMDGFQLPQGYKATTRIQFSFYHQGTSNSWYSFDRLRKVDKLSRPWSNPVHLNQVFLIILKSHKLLIILCTWIVEDFSTSYLNKANMFTRLHLKIFPINGKFLGKRVLW